MTLMIIGMIVFFAAHLIPMTPVRNRLVASLGENRYRAAFSVVSLVGIIGVGWGYATTRYGPEAANILYWPPVWGRHVTMLLVLLAFVAWGIYLHKGRLRKALRNPLSIGVVLWGVGHLFANGDLASVLLFGAFVVYGLVNILMPVHRPMVVFTPKPRHDIIAPIAGVIMYAVVLYLHPWLFGAHVLSF